MTRGPVGPKRWLGSKAKRISKGCKNSFGAFTPFQSNADSAATPIWARNRNPPALLLDENHGSRHQIRRRARRKRRVGAQQKHGGKVENRRRGQWLYWSTNDL